MTEQLTVGQLPRRRRAVVGQEHGLAAERSDVNGPRDQLLARAALASDQHREVVALQPLDLVGDACASPLTRRRTQAGAARATVPPSCRPAWPAARARRTARIPGARPPPSSARAAPGGAPAAAASRRDETRGRHVSRPIRSTTTAAGAVGAALQREACDGAGAVGIDAGVSEQRRSPGPTARRTPRRRRRRSPRSSAAASSRARSCGRIAASTSRRISASSASAGRTDVFAGARVAGWLAAPRVRPARSRVAPSDSKMSAACWQ